VSLIEYGTPSSTEDIGRLLMELQYLKVVPGTEMEQILRSTMPKAFHV
jgi:hypothetical protein